MANYDWMDPNLTPIGGAATALGNPWLTALGMMGKMGAGMLAGTDKQWLGAPGAVAADTARNVQAGDVNKDQLSTLMTLAKALQDPVMKGAKVVTKPDGTMSIDMSALAGTEQQAMNQPQGPAPRANMVPPQMQQSLAQEGAAGLGNFPFLQALQQQPWKQSQL
jgi:hypothetical protein